MGGRGKFDKSERRNNHPAAKPSDLDQFGDDLRKRKPVDPSVGGGNSKRQPGDLVE